MIIQVFFKNWVLLFVTFKRHIKEDIYFIKEISHRKHAYSSSVALCRKLCHSHVSHNLQNSFREVFYNLLVFDLSHMTNTTVDLTDDNIKDRRLKFFQNVIIHHLKKTLINRCIILLALDLFYKKGYCAIPY